MRSPITRRLPANFLSASASSARPDCHNFRCTVQLAIDWSEIQSFERRMRVRVRRSVESTHNTTPLRLHGRRSLTLRAIPSATCCQCSNHPIYRSPHPLSTGHRHQAPPSYRAVQFTPVALRCAGINTAITWLLSCAQVEVLAPLHPPKASIDEFHCCLPTDHRSVVNIQVTC